MDFEKLGAFYLGKKFDVSAQEPTDDLVLYDAKDLTTHAMCVGMTGSGKTGLCLSLLEEAAIDGVPAIAIDPKGDLGNLLLSFPGLSAGEFEPWIDPADATRRGQTVGERAESVAALWKKGLASWGQDGSRIQRFRDAVDITIYTPGSTAGVPLSVLQSFSAPSDAVLDDREALAERVSGSVSGLLGLAGIDADPIQSPEHIFLSNVLHRAWSEGRDLPLAELIRSIQRPPFDRVGVMDLDSFFPAKDRMKLALQINGVLASPGFQTWMEGEPLDVGKLFRTESGKPRLSILSIAHLNENERMFFVTLLLNEIVSWVRSQAGTSSLRALLYMDEVFGFLPPVANPPSKRPMLTLLKQARAYGLGVMLATQNPIDLDYKAVSNCGTWFLGRLQTQRDVDRVIDGLRGAADQAGKALDPKKIRSLLGGMKSRVFLMNNAHEDEPIVFHTRWALSYLRGPLTRSQIKKLTKEKKADVPVAAMGTPKPRRVADMGAGAVGGVAAAVVGGVTAEENDAPRPVLPDHVDECFVGIPRGRFAYQPGALATVRVHYARATAKVDTWWEPTFLVPLAEDLGSMWDGATVYDENSLEITDEPEEGGAYLPIPRGLTGKQKIRSIQAALKKMIYRDHELTLGYCKPYKLYSSVGESRAEFTARVQHAHREARDLALEKLRDKQDGKIEKLKERLRKAEQKVEKEKSEASRHKMDAAISIGTSVLGALMGRRVMGRATSAARGVGRAAQQSGDIDRARDDVAAREEELEEMKEELEQDLEALKARYEELPPIEEIKVRPKKSDFEISRFSIAWVPVAR